MTRKRGKAAVIDALITSGGFGDFGLSDDCAVTAKKSHAQPKERPSTASDQKPSSVFEPSVQQDIETHVQTHQASQALPLAAQRTDIGPIQQIHRQVPVADSVADIPDTTHGMVRLFIPCSIVSTWSLHDRKLIGEPDITDIYESILAEGQEEPCITRLSSDGKSIELIAGYRRYFAVQNTSTGYLLIDLYHRDHLNDRTAWIEMTRENNLDRKKCIPISVQVESDRKALAQGLFKNLSELSKAAGKAENWARQNKHLFELIPQQIRALCSQHRLASLTAPHYRKIGKLFKTGNQWRMDRVQSVIDNWDLLITTTDKFPIKQIEELLQSPSSDIKSLSNSAVKVRVDHNGNINLTVSRGLSHQQISALVKTVQNTIETLE